MRAALITLLMMFCVGAMAETSSSGAKGAETEPSSGESAVEDCKIFHKSAETIMSARQDGMSMVAVMDIAKGSKMLEGMTIMAYERPRYRTEKNQKSETMDFANEMYSMCLGARMKK